MERPFSLNLDSLPVDIMSENARKKYTEVFNKQNRIAENGKFIQLLEFIELFNLDDQICRFCLVCFIITLTQTIPPLSGSVSVKKLHVIEKTSCLEICSNL